MECLYRIKTPFFKKLFRKFFKKLFKNIFEQKKYSPVHTPRIELNDDDEDENEATARTAAPTNGEGKVKMEEDGLDIHAGGMEDLQEGKNNEEQKEVKAEPKAEPADDTGKHLRIFF